MAERDDPAEAPNEHLDRIEAALDRIAAVGRSPSPARGEGEAMIAARLDGLIARLREGPCHRGGLRGERRMAQVTVKINGYAYTVGCEDGQEQHLVEMAQQVEGRIDSIKALGGPSGEGRLLVLAALLMADELHDTNIELNNLRAIQPGGATAAKPDTKRLSRIARKAEEIAASVEQP